MSHFISVLTPYVNNSQQLSYSDISCSVSITVEKIVGNSSWYVLCKKITCFERNISSTFSLSCSVATYQETNFEVVEKVARVVIVGLTVFVSQILSCLIVKYGKKARIYVIIPVMTPIIIKIIVFREYDRALVCLFLATSSFCRTRKRMKEEQLQLCLGSGLLHTLNLKILKWDF